MDQGFKVQEAGHLDPLPTPTPLQPNPPPPHPCPRAVLWVFLPSGSYSKSIPRFVSTGGVRPGSTGCSGLTPDNQKKPFQE